VESRASDIFAALPGRAVPSPGPAKSTPAQHPESERAAFVNHKPAIAGANNPFTGSQRVFSNGTKGGLEGISRPFRGHIMVNALAPKEIFCIRADSQMRPPVIRL
jgi:hypothetical protein